MLKALLKEGFYPLLPLVLMIVCIRSKHYIVNQFILISLILQLFLFLSQVKHHQLCLQILRSCLSNHCSIYLSLVTLQVTTLLS